MEDETSRLIAGEDLESRSDALKRATDGILAKAPTMEASGVRAADAAAEEAIGRVAVAGFGSGVGKLLLDEVVLAAAAGPSASAPVFVDLEEVTRMDFEQVDKTLSGCKTLVVCPNPGDGTPQALEKAKAGLKALLASVPDGMDKAVLVSHVGAQDGKGGFSLDSFFGGQETSWADVEDELTSTARRRSSDRQLRCVIVRAGDPPAAGSAAGRVRCLRPGEGGGGSTSEKTVAQAIFNALLQGVNSSFTVVEEPPADPSPPSWPELLLPFVGPEVWRAEVDDAKRAIFFVQSWAEEFFGEGKKASRQGVKTPVQLRKTPAGVVFKFRPLGTDEDLDFDQLKEGGVEFVAEDPPGGTPRLRARRCAYGWKVATKENSETALLNKFAKDWADVSKE